MDPFPKIEIKVEDTVAAPVWSPEHESLASEHLLPIMAVQFVQAMTRTVWRDMRAESEIYALTQIACERFENSNTLSYIHVAFEEIEEPRVRRRDGGQALYTGGQRAPTHLSTTRDITEDTDSGIVCVIRYKRGDSSMFVQSALLHEIAHALRRLAYWRSRRRAPSVAPTPGAWIDIVHPWTHDVSAAGALVSALEEAGLWGRWRLDEAALEDLHPTKGGIHSGFGAEHRINDGICAQLLSETQDMCHADGSPLLEPVSPLRFALIQRRLEVPGEPLNAAFIGRQVLMDDVDIDVVKARPLLRWKALRNAARVRDVCCEADGGRACSRSDDSPTPPPSPPPHSEDEQDETGSAALCNISHFDEQ